MSNAQKFYSKGKYNISFGVMNDFSICYNGLKVSGGTYWQTADPVMSTLPVFLLQLSAVIMISRVFNIFLRPLRQPRYLSELLAAVLLGPSGLGMAGWVTENLIPFEAGLFLETMANLGVTFYMFLVGLEMDLTPLRKIERTALTVAIAGIVLPVAVGVGVHTIVLKLRENIDVPEMGAYFWSIALSHTSFPDLARILSDLKLMYTDLGKTALTAALVNDISCSFLLVVAVSLINGEKELYVAIPVLLCMTIFWFSLRPFIRKNSSVMVFLVILVAISAKIVGALLVCLFFKSPMRDGLALGLLMNTKGVLAVIIINEGRNMKGFDQQTYSWIVVAILLMTVIIGPVVSYTHRSARHLRSYNEMHLERRKEVSEFFESDDEQEIFPDRFERERQKQLDDDYINVFRSRTMHDQSITYIEKQVSSGDQIVSALSSAYNDFDLYVVGRGHDRTSPLTSGLSNWSEFPELGPLGETLVLMDLNPQRRF
ncbi:hypothetical protein V6N13_024965 [Hibiscus sabdariffa]